jgi:hypothetical protein
MSETVFRKIVELVRSAQDLAVKVGLPNILQPGLVKEIIIADILGHKVISSKRNADACDPQDPSIQYEYLSCKEGGSGQLDRMFKEPQAERVKSLERITRNKMVYYAIFYKSNQLKPKCIYEITPEALLKETVRQLDQSKNAISHVGFSNNWAHENGRIVYEDSKE